MMSKLILLHFYNNLLHFYNTCNILIYSNIEIYCFIAFYWSSWSQNEYACFIINVTHVIKVTPFDGIKSPHAASECSHFKVVRAFDRILLQ